MPYKDPEKEKARSLKRRKYFKEYHRKHYELKTLGLYKSQGGNQRRLLKSPEDYKRKLGWEGENIALQVLTGSEFIGKPSDLRWEGKLVEVKTAKKVLVLGKEYPTNKTKFCKTYRWKFYLKQLRQVDIFFIICKNQKEKVEHIFLIPDRDLKTKNFSLAESKISFYKKYRLAS